MFRNCLTRMIAYSATITGTRQCMPHVNGSISKESVIVKHISNYFLQFLKFQVFLFKIQYQNNKRDYMGSIFPFLLICIDMSTLPTYFFFISISVLYVSE